MQDTFDYILLVEVVLPFLILSVVLSIVLFRRKAQDKSALQRLINQYKEKEDGRRESTIEFLKNKAGLEDPAREEASQKLLKARKTFIQKLITTFLTRKAESIANLDNELSVITSAYHELSVKLPTDEIREQKEEDEPQMAAAMPEKITEDNSELEKEIKRLKKENKNLKMENQTTLSTLNSIFAEYTSMFGEESEKKDMTVDDILTAMESFGDDDVDAASESDSLGEGQSITEPKAEEPEPKAEEPEPKAEEPEPKAEEPEPKAEEPEPKAEEPEPKAEEPEPKAEEPEPKAEEPEPKAEEPEPKAEEPEPKAEEPEPKAEEPEPKAEEPEPKAEEPEPKADEPEPKADEPDAEPSWDDAFAETEDFHLSEAEVETKINEADAEAEPSWDDAFAEAEEPEVKSDEQPANETKEVEKK